VTSLVLTITETLRYRGKIGQYSWALHRVAGLGTLIFFVIHVIDTSWAVFFPELYREAISIYQSPLFTVGEFGLIACVVYHAYNGFRIIVMDYRPHLWRYQARAAQMVLAATAITLVPVFVLMANHVVRHYRYNAGVFDLKLQAVVSSQVPFAIGSVVIFVAAILISVLVGGTGLLGAGKSTGKQSRVDTIMWTYMRISGLLIIPLVFGHLAMMHIIQGVFDLTAAGYPIVGTNLINQSGTAAEFVAGRWNYTLGAVYIWRIYDIMLLSLVSIHGFYGLRYILSDYFKAPVLRRAFNLTVIALALGYIAVGGLAILQSVPHTANELLNGEKPVSEVVE